MPECRSTSVHFFHLKKTGGTTMNAWLDMLFADPDTDRGPEPGVVGELLAGTYNSFKNPGIRNTWMRGCAPTLFCMDSLHTHMPVPTRLRPGSFSFTVLREPRSRILSQVADFRRLTAADLGRLPEPSRTATAEAAAVTTRQFLEIHGQTLFRSLFDNYLVRAMAAMRLGFHAETDEDIGKLFDVAAEVLMKDFDFVGRSDRLDATCRAVAKAVGVPTPGALAARNVTRGGSASLDDVPDHLVKFDLKLWELAESLERRSASDYDRRTFEALHGPGLAGRLTGRIDANRVSYSVRQPLFGEGLHGRDAAGSPQCAVWTGVESALYVPAPRGRRVQALVWVRGYASPAVRESVRMRAGVIPGGETPTFEPGYECEEIMLSAPFHVGDDFFRLDMVSEQACSQGVCGAADEDPRIRGICFDRYGWQLAES